MTTRYLVPAWCAVLTLTMLAPVLLPGFVLTHDMVFTPHQPLVPDSVGFGDALPRAVPADAVISLLSKVVDGQIAEKAVLLGSVFFAGLGAAKLLDQLPARLIAATAYCWNPYIAERLWLGHWPIVVAYATLPWIANAATALRHGERGAWARLLLASAPAALGPTGGLLATGTGIAAAGWRRGWVPFLLGVVLNLPWVVPALLHAGTSSPAAVAAFAARAENWGGTLLAVLGLGGIWNAEAVPGSRASPVIPVLTMLILAVCVVGARAWLAHPAAKPLLVLGILGVLLAFAGATGPGAGLLRWAVLNIPGTGLIRDGQRFAAWWALPLSLGFALGVHRIARKLADMPRRVVLTIAVALPVALLPDLVGAGGRLRPVPYPADFTEVTNRVGTAPGDVLVLPLGSYRRFPWNPAPVLDPAPRWLPRPTVTEDTLIVNGVRIEGENPRVAEVRAALAAHRPLGLVGVGWVLIERTAADQGQPAMTASLLPVFHGEWLALYRVPGPITVRGTTVPVLVLLADMLAALAVLAAALRSLAALFPFAGTLRARDRSADERQHPR